MSAQLRCLHKSGKNVEIYFVIILNVARLLESHSDSYEILWWMDALHHLKAQIVCGPVDCGGNNAKV